MNKTSTPFSPEKPYSTSTLLQGIAFSGETEWTVGRLSAALGERGLGLGLFLFALTGAIPIPGFASLTGIIVLFFAVQLVMARDSIWLPKWLAQKPIQTSHLQSVLTRTLPWMRKVERFIRPRFDLFNHEYVHKLTGVLIVIEAIIVILPIPLANLMPSIAIAIMALAIVERDGLLLSIGWAMCVVSIFYIYLLVSGYGWLVLQAIENFW